MVKHVQIQMVELILDCRIHLKKLLFRYVVMYFATNAFVNTLLVMMDIAPPQSAKRDSVSL